MRFDQFVHKYTKGVFAFIIVVMVVPLVLWGYMGGGPTDQTDEPAGTVQSRVRGTVTVMQGEFLQQRYRAVPAWWWKKWNDRMTMMMAMRFGKNPDPPKEEEVEKQAWDNIVLLQDAREMGFTATKQEADILARRVYHHFTNSWEVDLSILEKIARDLFHTTQEIFDAWTLDQVVMDKLLETVSEAEFADYDRVYDRVLRQDQYARVWYASFDPKDFEREKRPPTPDEILRHYDQNKAKFRTPEKARVSYLMADFEALKKKVPEPTEDEIRKYYQDNPGQFEEEHKHGPGEEHKEDEKRQVKPLDHVRTDVVSRIKQRAAEKEADQIMDKVNVDLGAAAAANKGKYPENILETLKEKFGKEGAELVFSNTAAFDRKQLEEIEKEVGTNSGLAQWAFDATVKEGEIGQKAKTSKGVCLFRLDGRKAGGDLGVTEAARTAIVKDLQKEQVKKKTQAKASAVVQDISAKGIAAARAERALEWRVTRYFKTQGGDTGIEDRGLSFAVSQQVSSGKVKPGQATVVQGSSVGRDLAEWAYVVYLEDLAGGPPQESEEQLVSVRESENRATRDRYRDEYVEAAVRQANVNPVKNSGPTKPKSE
jgi:hypothetical protein